MILKLSIAAVAVAGVSVAIALLAFSVRSSMHPATRADYPGFNSFLVFRTPGSGVITKAKAIKLAAHFGGPGPPRARDKVMARYGLFSDNTMCRQKPGSSKCVLQIQKVPAWVVTATGPDECTLPEGPVTLPGRLPLPRFHPSSSCAWIVVIDARSGHPLLSFN